MRYTTQTHHPFSTSIGVFDSGIGGLSVLRALVRAMPQQHFIYVADTAYAPYGERSPQYIQERSCKIARWMHDQQRTAGFVIACNTATAASLELLTQQFETSWPIIGVKPGLKPAAKLSKKGHVGVMATQSTLNSVSFNTLMQEVISQSQKPLRFTLCPCEGLAKAIEHHDEEQTERLIEHYASTFHQDMPDVIALGCTHYCLITERIAKVLPDAYLLDTGDAIAQRVQKVFLSQTETKITTPQKPATLDIWTNASTQELKATLARWLPQTLANIHTLPDHI